MNVNNNVNIYSDFEKVKLRIFAFKNIHHTVFSSVGEVQLVLYADAMSNRGLKISVTKICQTIVL